MELRQLKYFIAVVEEGTVSGAARALHMSQPPLTAQMHALESELGCALFEHAGRRLRITEAGRALYARARAIAALCDGTVSELHDLGAGASGILRIGVISSVCGAEFIGWLGAFARAHAGVRYDLHEANTYQLLAMLRSRTIDLAIVRTPFAAPDMCARALRREPMAAVGRSAPAGSGDGRIALSALAGAPLVIYRRWESILRDRFEQLGIAPSIVCVNDSAQTSLALAREGLGVALVPLSALAGAELTGLEARILEERGAESEIDAVYRSDAELTAPARLFLDSLSAAVRD